MISEKKFNKEVDLIIANGIREDIGDGDHSSLACIPYDARGKAKLLVKEDGIISGIEFAKRVFDYVDPGLKLELLVDEERKAVAVPLLAWNSLAKSCKVENVILTLTS